jgi:hypothetical protein
MRFRNVTTHFEELKLKATRSGRCAGCQKRTSRVLKVSQTLNPFNKNAKGLPKSRFEIMEELRIRLAERRTQPLLCTGCEDAARPPPPWKRP